MTIHIPRRLAGPLLAAALLGSAPAPALAQSAPAAIPYSQTFVTHHAGVFGRIRMRYTASVRSTVLTDAAGVPAANFVTTDYVRDDVKDHVGRPVIFAWAGGPSNASVAYHTRLLGPKRIMDPAPGHEAEGPTLVDNPDWLLDVADIVLVDPVGTGFSRILPGGKLSDFYSVAGDAASIEQFMAVWLKNHGREASPRYVMGGSYGSVRSIRIAWDLRNSPHPVDGVIVTADSAMIKQIGGIMGPVTALPSEQMTAIYHGKVDRHGLTDAQIVDDAYRFAMNEYLPALATVQDLTPAAKAAMAQKLAARTGIGADVYLAHDLELPWKYLPAHLLQDRGLVLTNPNDGRETAKVMPPESDESPVPALFKTYLARDLGVTYPMADYNGEAPNSNRDWVFAGPKEALTGIGGNDWAEELRQTMAADPKVRVYSANGYYDNLSALGQARYMFSRTRLPKDRIVVREYPGGHALYADPPTAVLIARDIREMMAAR
jgi:carboxypeptidase C (cathepsin A)